MDWGVCQQVREFSDVPIVMLTAKGDEHGQDHGIEYGADDYITKPFNILEVRACKGDHAPDGFKGGGRCKREDRGSGRSCAGL